MEQIKCSCGNTISSKFQLYLDILESTKDPKTGKYNKELALKILNIHKQCCRLKFITAALITNYL